MASAVQNLIVNIVKRLQALPPSKWSRCGRFEFFEATLGGEHPILIEV